MSTKTERLASVANDALREAHADHLAIEPGEPVTLGTLLAVTSATGVPVSELLARAGEDAA